MNLAVAMALQDLKEKLRAARTAAAGSRAPASAPNPLVRSNFALLLALAMLLAAALTVVAVLPGGSRPGGRVLWAGQPLQHLGSSSSAAGLPAAAAADLERQPLVRELLSRIGADLAPFKGGGITYAHVEQAYCQGTRTGFRLQVGWEPGGLQSPEVGACAGHCWAEPLLQNSLEISWL